MLVAAVATPQTASAQPRLGVLVSQTEGRADIERAVVAALRARTPESQWEAADAVRGAWSFIAPSPTASVTDPLAQQLRARLRLTTLFVIETRAQGGDTVALAVQAHDARPTPTTEFASVPSAQAPSRAAQLAEHVWSRISRGTSSAGATGSTTGTAPSTAAASAAPAPAARPELGFSLASGSSLTAAQLRGPLGSARRSLTSCGANIQIRYALQASLRVGADGAVQATSTRLLEGTPVDSVTECVRRAAGAVRFPAVGRTSEVRLRLVFPGAAAARPSQAAVASPAPPATPSRPVTPGRITVVNEQTQPRWIFVDGRLVATLAAGQRRSVEVTPGAHRVVSSRSIDPADHPVSREMTLQPGGHSQWRLAGPSGVQIQRHAPVLYPED